MIKLKPCPFCGCESIGVGCFEIVPEMYVECADCGVGYSELLHGEFDTLEELEEAAYTKAVELWNRRVEVFF